MARVISDITGSFGRVCASCQYWEGENSLTLKPPVKGRFELKDRVPGLCVAGNGTVKRQSHQSCSKHKLHYRFEMYK